MNEGGEEVREDAGCVRAWREAFARWDRQDDSARAAARADEFERWFCGGRPPCTVCGRNPGQPQYGGRCFYCNRKNRR